MKIRIPIGETVIVRPPGEEAFEAVVVKLDPDYFWPMPSDKQVAVVNEGMNSPLIVLKEIVHNVHTGEVFK